jgi:formylmethanofuran dehydrogenase subunit C
MATLVIGQSGRYIGQATVGYADPTPPPPENTGARRPSWLQHKRFHGSPRDTSAAVVAGNDIAALGTLSITGVADLDATGALLAAGALSITGAADLDATGTLLAAGSLSITGAADLDATGALVAAGSLSISGVADLDAIGQLLAAGSVVINGVADLTSSVVSDISAVGSISITGVADLDATGSLIAAGALSISGVADLDASGSLVAAGELSISGAADLDASGALVAAGALSISGAADLDAIGQLLAAGSIFITGVADLTSPIANDIAAVGSLSITGAADLDAIGSLIAAGTISITGIADLNAVVPPATDILQGGAGYPVYWQGKRRRKRLEDQPNLHLRKILDDVVNELYGELTDDDVPQEVQAQAAQLVKPFVDRADRKVAIPLPSAVDWSALERDAKRVRALIRLWREQEWERQILDEDDFMLMMD